MFFLSVGCNGKIFFCPVKMNFINSLSHILSYFHTLPQYFLMQVLYETYSVCELVITKPYYVNLFGSVASVSGGYDFEEYSRIPDTLRHQTRKIVERRLASRLTENLSFLNHANVFNS